ncbi:MAG TPA: hypothetical protein VJQ77_02015 [Novosphingobium sp.]|nr:hypothetical protein [Novosphingobium sp.]
MGLRGSFTRMKPELYRSARLASVSAVLLAAGAIGGCHRPAQDMPGNSEDHRPWHGITVDEEVRFTGTEPFWGGEISGTELTYKTPDQPKGERIAVSRFAGRGGLSFSGKLAAGPMTLAVTPGKCSDGMSDRAYPFMATLQIGSEVRQGCAWTDRQPYAGGEAP